MKLWTILLITLFRASLALAIANPTVGSINFSNTCGTAPTISWAGGSGGNGGPYVDNLYRCGPGPCTATNASTLIYTSLSHTAGVAQSVTDTGRAANASYSYIAYTTDGSKSGNDTSSTL